MDAPYSVNEFLDDLLVVLVIYKMKITKSPAFISLSDSLRSISQSTYLFIYDNSPQPQSFPTLDHFKIHYQNDQRNSGVSAAYNQGFRLAKSLNKKWILLADQDTIFPPSSFTAYNNSLINYKQSIIVPILTDDAGIISPFKSRWGGGKRIRQIYKGIFSVKDFLFTNSGLLISVNEFESAGMYDEQLPLDFSDFSFVYRLRKCADFFCVADLTCKHSLSSTLKTPLHERLARFAVFSSASRIFKRKYAVSRLIFFRTFLHGLKLSFQYRSLLFIKLFFSHD